MRVLVIDRRPPLDLTRGDSLIGRHVFARLAEFHELTLVAPATRDESDSGSELLRLGFSDVRLIPKAERVATVGGYVSASAARWSPALQRFAPFEWATEMRRQIDSLVENGSFDLIHARQLPIAPLVAGSRHLPGLLELVDSPTLQARRRLRPTSPKSIARFIASQVVEAHAVRRFSVISTVSEADAATTRTLSPTSSVRVIPNGVDVNQFRPFEMPEDPDSVLFVGAMSYPPNVEAVARFHAEVWPEIQRLKPSAKLIVCGRNPQASIRALAADPSVTVTGEVDDVRPYLGGAAVVICPMHSGSGVKNKALEALAMGKAIVSTPLGVEALSVSNRRHALVSPFGRQFARQVLELLDNPRLRYELGAAGRKYVVENHSWDACAATYNGIYHELASEAFARAADEPLAASNPNWRPA